MIEKLIRFIPEMVHAIESGAKTQTRRMSKKGEVGDVFFVSHESSLTIRLTRVWQERLSNISESDARAEGILNGGCLTCGESEPCGCNNPRPSARDEFIHLWISIYDWRPGCAWLDDPLVWVHEFEVVANNNGGYARGKEPNK